MIDTTAPASTRQTVVAEYIAARWQMESANAEPVPEGKSVVILGEVLSVKAKENGYGVRLVMTVRDDHGFKVWGTVPRAIDDVQVGDRVTFVASVERSDRDRAFGFFKRPRDAHRI